MTRLERGAGLPAVERLAYWPELVSKQLDGLEHLILAGATAPYSSFAYQGKDSSLVPAGCEVHELSPPTSDVLRSLEELVEALHAAERQARTAISGSCRQRPSGPLTAREGLPGDRRDPARRGDPLRRSDHLSAGLAGQYRGGSQA